MTTYFGEKVAREKEIVAEIVFLRESKKLSYRAISDELNAQGKWPRWAKKWMWVLVRRQYLFHKSPGRKNGNGG